MSDEYPDEVDRLRFVPVLIRIVIAALICLAIWVALSLTAQPDKVQLDVEQPYGVTLTDK